MALIYMDGFDCYEDTAALRRAGYATEDATDAGLNTSNGLNGGGCLFIDTGSADRLFRGFPASFVPGDTVTVSCWVKSANDGISSDSIFEWIGDDGTTVLANIELDNSGGMTVGGVSGAGFGSTSTGLITNTYHFLQWQVTFGTNATTGAVNVKLDGTTVFTTSGVDTHTGAAPARLSIGGGRNLIYIDDLVVSDDSGSTLTDFPDEYVIETLNVDSDGGTVDWARNAGANDYEAVDDPTGSADDATTYVASSTPGQETRFGMAAISGSVVDVYGVQICAKMAKQDAGTRTVRGLFNNSGGASENLGEVAGLTTDWAWHRLGMLTTDLAAGALDEADVNAMEFGVEVVT